MADSRKGTRRKTSGCPICAARRQKGTTEVYAISEKPEGSSSPEGGSTPEGRSKDDRYYFNVDKAKALAGDGRSPVAVAESTLHQIAALNNYSQAHLPHVDPDRPGIGVRRFGGLVLLDGIHRAVRCLAEGKTFFVRMLSYEESLACLVRQEIASTDAEAIVAKLRKVLSTAPTADPIEAEIECTPKLLAEVQAMLTPEERRRLILTCVPPRRKE